jgi:hypothetical protein
VWDGACLSTGIPPACTISWDHAKASLVPVVYFPGTRPFPQPSQTSHPASRQQASPAWPQAAAGSPGRTRARARLWPRQLAPAPGAARGQARGLVGADREKRGAAGRPARVHDCAVMAPARLPRLPHVAVAALACGRAAQAWAESLRARTGARPAAQHLPIAFAGRAYRAWHMRCCGSRRQRMVRLRSMVCRPSCLTCADVARGAVEAGSSHSAQVSQDARALCTLPARGASDARTATGPFSPGVGVGF